MVLQQETLETYDDMFFYSIILCNDDMIRAMLFLIIGELLLPDLIITSREFQDSKNVLVERG
jgi:hypothetical protein